jgi:ribosomal protein S18 acetylase RimI-like enzyme
MVRSLAFDRAAFEPFAPRFSDDPLYRAAEPDAVRRDLASRAMFGFFYSYALRYGEAWFDGYPAGAIALLLPPKEGDIRALKALAAGALALPFAIRLRALARFAGLDRAASSARRRDCPDGAWYLLALASHPEGKGRGRAARLLEDRLDALAGAPCYLETQNDANVAYYRRFGFALASTTELPRLGLRHHSMLRA